MMADGSGDFARATGLTLDLTARGMGVRSNRYSMLVVDGVVKTINIEAPGKFEVSDAGTILSQCKNA
jgi:peroxiredoxin